MALTKEDKKDVSSKFGKALANKVEKATKDKKVGISHPDFIKSVVKNMDESPYLSKSYSPKSQALAKKAGSREKIKKGEYGAREQDFNRPLGKHANFAKIHKLDY